MKKGLFAILSLCCLLCCMTNAPGQIKEMKKCISRIDGGDYKLISSSKLSDQPKSVHLYIVVNPKRLNKDGMILVAKRLKDDYCDVEHLTVVIFDNRKFANSISMSDFIKSKGKTVLMRGFYSFDRTSGEEGIEFSTKRGNPTSEVKINLANLQNT